MRVPVAHLRGEAEYFHQLDVELCDKIFRRAEFKEKRQRLEESLKIHEPAVLDALTALNYDASSATLVFIVPLIQVAWAPGPPIRAVRKHIIALASRHGVEAGTPACERLSAWLDRRPADDFFEGTLNAIARFVSSLPPLERFAVRDALVSSCREAAAVHCRLLSWSHRICAAKRKVIVEISRRLETEPQAPV
ncbi:MAG: hypothetical protein LLG20_01505 [Acidobacteriales bacterium]|nr:hypothetical protein [Terriglobales bacterium]